MLMDSYVDDNKGITNPPEFIKGYTKEKLETSNPIKVNLRYNIIKTKEVEDVIWISSSE